MNFYLFSGAGNKFVVLDGRTEDMAPLREKARIEALCREYGTDGLMILTDARSEPGMTALDFAMEFYNPDGSGGMMCGNGGRCIVAFASLLGIRPAEGGTAGEGTALSPGVYRFRAADGIHTGEILSHPEPGLWQVRIGMIDVQGVTPVLGGWFLNTGTRHFVRFVDDVEAVDVEQEGKALRWNPAFAPEGTNVNFVQVAADGLHVRTFEKGVEGETLACGTGLTASALAAYYAGKISPPASPGRNDRDARSEPGMTEGTGSVHVALRAREDWLAVDFRPAGEGRFMDVYLSGPACVIERPKR